MATRTNFTRDQMQNAKRVFLTPRSQYSWDEIVTGVKVTSNGVTKGMWAVDRNTVRGFWRNNKSCAGALHIFQEYFVQNKCSILNELLHVQSEDELHGLEQHICCEIKPHLRTVIRAHKLESYNKIRKPVDLYLQHLIAMSPDLKQRRLDLTPLLFLPLDSQTLQKLFTIEELSEHKLGRRPTFESVYEEDVYLSLQRLAQEKADKEGQRLGSAFYRIYFEMLWNNRLGSKGGNLFETNLG